jgi:hypothetical protein
VVAPGGLEDGSRDAAFQQPVGQGAAAGPGVVERAVEVESESVDVEKSSFDLPTSMPATIMKRELVIPANRSFCDSGLYQRFRPGRAGIDAAGRPGSGTRPGTRGEDGPPRTEAGRALLHAAAVAYATCGTAKRGS